MQIMARKKERGIMFENNRYLSVLAKLKFVDRNSLIPNDYNPNKVSRQNLELLTTSIFVNGFTMPIVIRPDNTIVDGFHRWTISGPQWTYIPKFTNKEYELLGIDKNDRRSLFERLDGKVPVVTVEQKEESMYLYGTITHNRARGTHLLEPMKAIVKRLLNEGKEVAEVAKQLGMKPEEVFRLSDFSREDFLEMMSKGHTYSKAEYITKM